MTELYPSDSDLNSLSGTGDGEQDVTYPSIYEAPYYTTFYKMLYRLLDVARRAGDMRVYKDGDLTFGARAGRFFNGDTLQNYSGAVEQSLTNNDTNYIYLTAGGTLSVNTSGFPTPSVTPHIRLATIVTSAGQYDHDDITDYRGAAFASVAGTAGLAADVQDKIPQLVLTGTDDGDGTGTCAIQVKDLAGNNLSERFLVRTWIADAEWSEPDPQVDFSILAGEQMRQIEADADYEVISDATGAAGMNIDAGGAKTVYVMAEIDGRIYSSGALVITVP